MSILNYFRANRKRLIMTAFYIQSISLLVVNTANAVDTPCAPSDCSIGLGSYRFTSNSTYVRLTTSTTVSNGRLWASTYSSGVTKNNMFSQEAGVNQVPDFNSKTSWVSSDRSDSTGSDSVTRSTKFRSSGYSTIAPAAGGYVDGLGWLDQALGTYYNKWESEICPAPSGDGCTSDEGEQTIYSRENNISVSGGRFGGVDYVCNLGSHPPEDPNNFVNETGSYYTSSTVDGMESYTGRYEVWFSSESHGPLGTIPYLIDTITRTDYPREGDPATTVYTTRSPLTGASGSGPAVDPNKVKLPEGSCRAWSHQPRIVYAAPPPPRNRSAAASLPLVNQGPVGNVVPVVQPSSTPRPSPTPR